MKLTLIFLERLVKRIKRHERNNNIRRMNVRSNKKKSWYHLISRRIRRSWNEEMGSDEFATKVVVVLLAGVVYRRKRGGVKA